MRLLCIGILLLISNQCFVVVVETAATDENAQQIKLEDIERDNLESEKHKHELLQTQSSEGIKTSGPSGPSAQDGGQPENREINKEQGQTDVTYLDPNGYPGPYAFQYVTGLPNAIEYRVEQKNFGNDVQTQQQQLQYVPPVHEADITYTVGARQSLTKPIIGGNAPVAQFLTPQPQFVYVTATSPGNAGAGADIGPRQVLAAQPFNVRQTNKLTMYEEEQQLLQQHLQNQQQLHGRGGQFVQPEAQKSNYVQIFTPAPNYVMIPYPYQLPHPQHQQLVASATGAPSPPPSPGRIQVPDTSVFALSQGETGHSIGGLSSPTSTARPLLPTPLSPPAQIAPQYAPHHQHQQFAQIPFTAKPAIALSQRYTSTGLGFGLSGNGYASGINGNALGSGSNKFIGSKYITSIEPQLILGPFSLPPTLQHFPNPNPGPSGGYNYAPPRPPFNFEYNNFGSFLSNRRPLFENSFTAPASLKVKPLVHSSFTNNPSPAHHHYHHNAQNHLQQFKQSQYNPYVGAPSQHVYNTIAYSVPMGPHKLKRDSTIKS